MLRCRLLLLVVLCGSGSLYAEGQTTQSAEENAVRREADARAQTDAADATASEAAQTGTGRDGIRLLYLEPKSQGMASDEQEILAGLLYDALSGQERILLITADDLRRRAPMEADRIDDCRDEICLYEFSESVNAAYVLFSEVQKDADGQIQLDISMFHPEDAEIRARQTMQKESVSAFSGFVRPAVQSILSEALQETQPKLLENRFFLGSLSVLSLGTMAGLASLGYALELESALARPDVHRTEKERALEQGPAAIWVGVGSASVAMVGLIATGIAAWSHYASGEE